MLYNCNFLYSCCDLIGQLPVCLGGEGSSLLDQVQLDFLVSSHLTVLRAGLFEALLKDLVRPLVTCNRGSLMVKKV